MKIKNLFIVAVLLISSSFAFGQVTITVSGDSPVWSETVDKLTDGNLTNKWGVTAATAWIQFAYSTAQVKNMYSLTSAPDGPERDFKTWTVEGSNDGISWTVLDRQTNHAAWASRSTTLDFYFTNATAYTYYKVNIAANQGDGYIQLAEIAFGNGVPPSGFTVSVSGDSPEWSETKDKLTDGILTNKWGVTAATAWIEFAYGVATIKNMYSLTSAPDGPSRDFKTWTVEGSNNGTSWTVLDTRTNQPAWALRSTTLDFYFTNTTAYSYYRINVSANQGDGYIQLAEITFGTSVPALTVTVCGDSPSWNETVDKLTDGNLNNKWGVEATAAWIQFAYSTPIVNNRYSLTSGNDDSTRDFKDWTVQGSMNGTSWTVLDTQTGHAPWAARNSTLDFDFVNTTAYNYYKIDITANNGNGSYTQLSEIAFSMTIGAEANISTISGLTSASNLTVTNGGTLTIDATKTVNSITVAPQGKLTLSNGVTLGGTVTLQSTIDGTATMLDSYATPTKSAIVEQYVTLGRNWYMSSPVTAADYSWLNRGTSVNEWNESTKTWVSVTSGTLVKGKGYVQVATSTPAPTGTTGTVSVIGTTNSGTIPVTVTRTESGLSRGFNLVGNPYPSYLKWSGLNGFITDATNDSISTSFWYRTKNTDGAYIFSTYNGSSNEVVGGTTANTLLNEYIPPMQAFWIRVNQNTAVSTHHVVINFKNNMRLHGVGDNNKFKAPRANERQRLRLQLANGTATDEALIYFDANAANSFDNYDSPKMANNSTVIPDIYTKVDTEKLVINGLNAVTDNMVLPLGFKTGTAGNLTLKVNEMSNFDNNTRIYLLDGNTETELTPATEYVFNTAVTSGNETRLSLLFRAPGASTGLENANKLQAQVYVDAANQITIVAPEKSSYSIYNAVGMLVDNGRTTAKLYTANCKLQTGVYVVSLSENGKELTTRVIIK